MTNREAFHLACELDTPVTVERFRAAFPEERASAFILDNSGSRRLDLASFMGAAPTATFRARRTAKRDELGRVLADVTVEQEDGSRTVIAAADPFHALDDFRRAHAVSSELDRRYPFPFRAGLVGYIGYECSQTLERLPGLRRPSIGMPDMALALHRWIIATRRECGTSWLSVVGFGTTRTDARADAEAIRDRVLAALRGPRSKTTTSARGVLPRITSGLSATEYMARVAQAQGHIATGDAFEICLTNALRTPFSRTHATELFDELRLSNPAPFAAFLDLPEGTIVSSSPERFLSLNDARIAESRPIKGTRPRGSTPEDDTRLACELATSEKDRAENAMIVDLVRNDLGRVCRFGTVEAPELFAVEPYATVHQLVSTVRGELAEDKTALDLLRACFPPGSMTGAPKIEAMTILEQLEPVERGVYSGALGWFDLGGAMDLSVVIRTIVIGDEVATFSVGGAVVADSDPQLEHEETEHKARALVRALESVARRGAARPPGESRTEVEQPSPPPPEP